MKKTLLFGIMLVSAVAVNGQQRMGRVTGTTTLGDRAMGTSREVTDTIAPGNWINDPNTQLYRYGALCGEEPDTYGCGYIIGSNEYGDKVKAQQFLLDAPTNIEGVIFWFYHKAGNESSSARARIYNITGAGRNSSWTPPQPGEPLPPAIPGIAPGTVAGSKNFTLAEVDTTNDNGFTTIMFDNPVYVGVDFAAGFDMSTLTATDTLALLGTDDGVTDFPDYSWEQWDDNSWWSMNLAWGLNIDFAIFVLVDNSSVGIGEVGHMNNMRMSFLNGNISNGTVLLGYELEQSGRMDLLVHNSTGKVMMEQSLGNQTVGGYNHSFSTEGWAAGTYFVTLKNDGRPLTKKLVVQ